MGDNFPKILSGLRREKGLNQRTAAAALNISQALLSHYENGLREPGLDFIRTACAYYGVSSDYLLGLSSVRTPLTGGAASLGPVGSRLSEMLASVFSELLRSLSQCENRETQEVISGMLSVFFYGLMRPHDTQGQFETPGPVYPALCDAYIRLCQARLASDEAAPEFSTPENLKKSAEAVLEAVENYWR